MPDAFLVTLQTGANALHPITLGLFGVALLASLGVMLFGLLQRSSVLSLPRSERHLRNLNDRSGTPAVSTDRSGRVLWANAAAEQAGVVVPDASFAEGLKAHYDADASVLYRLERTVRARGLGLATLENRETRERYHLAGQALDGRRVLWTLQRAKDIAPDAPMERDAAFATSSLALASVASDGRISTNARFRELFAVRAKAVLDRLPTDRAPEGGRILLPVSEGREQVFRVVAVPGAEEGQRDFVFFPTSRSAEVPFGPATMLEAVPVALLRLDLQGRIMWSNRRARKLLGDRLEIGKGLGEVIEPLGRPVSAIIGSAMRGIEGAREMVRLPVGGRDTFLRISLTRVALDEHGSLIAVLADASDLRQLEDQFAQSHKMEAIGKLAGGVAHDFNNVLTAISGHSDLLLLGKDAGDPDYSDLTQIRQNANRAAALVRQLLAFSRKQTLSMRVLSVGDVISETLYLLDRLMGGAVNLRLENAPNLGSVRADQQQLEQVLMNLVVNARDAMPDGGTVTIATRNRSFETEVRLDELTIPPGEYVEITVEDEGSGIPRHVLPRLFEPFFTTKGVGEGTGLGLSTVYGIVKQSGGLLTASNREVGGARFRILLPRVASGSAAAAEPATAPAPAGPAERAPASSAPADMTGKGVVLIVEDEAPV
ncbi:MAG TPA: ATP-binding protein, partial [Thermohalobaculum sp.]|nr:ATP-binding protein [Thermohalobaculum sp.]